MSTPSGSLYRQEALQSQRQQWLGDLRLVTPLPARMLIALAASLVLMLALFAASGSYTRRVPAAGMLAPASGLLSLTAMASGRVQRLDVREGDSVRAGQVLAVVGSERHSLAGDTSRAVLDQLHSQRARLDGEIHEAGQLTAEQRLGLQQRIVLLRAQSASLEQRRALAIEQADQSAELLQRITPLGGKGYVSAFEIARQRSLKIEAHAQVKALDQQLLEQRAQLTNAQDQLRQLPINLASQRSTLARQRDGIEQAIAQAEAERATVLRAPRSGQVTAVLAVEGQAVAPGQVLLALAPVGVPLQADLLLPGEAAGFVRAGQRVALRLSAFPYQKFGLLGGTVERVSQSALNQTEIATLLGAQAPPTPLYRVRVTLDAQHVMAYGEARALKPGMVLDADVLLERRRLIEWVFEPLYGFARRLPAAVATSQAHP